MLAEGIKALPLQVAPGENTCFEGTEKVPFFTGATCCGNASHLVTDDNQWPSQGTHTKVMNLEIKNKKKKLKQKPHVSRTGPQRAHLGKGRWRRARPLCQHQVHFSTVWRPAVGLIAECFLQNFSGFFHGYSSKMVYLSF